MRNIEHVNLNYILLSLSYTVHMQNQKYTNTYLLLAPSKKGYVRNYKYGYPAQGASHDIHL
uniref:Putative ovule protein n=1 Tax=Solanum chacoense TaxID=4108 RepID=A0A0V0HEX7_SOLCH